MKNAEREAEAAEEARIKKAEEREADDAQKGSDALASLKKSGGDTPMIATPPVEETPVDSGVATPTSDAPMPPPRAPSSNKQKPAALKLETSKQVEPAQPSAALLSLKSARRITSIKDITYPESIASPNPALNTAFPGAQFIYNRDFLLQFQRAFTEKPSEHWTDIVKDTIGDTSEPASGSRGGTIRSSSSNMGSRQPSIRGGMPPQQMGTFGASGSRTLPPGSTSETRFQASKQGINMGGAARPTMQNPLASFARPPGGGSFPMGGMSRPMDRVPSANMSAHPQSPRTNTSGGRGGGSSRKPPRPVHNEKDNSKMPLTAGVNLKPIEVSASGWKPTSVGQGAAGFAGPVPGGDGYLAPDVVQRKVKSMLNKMTPSNFDKIADQILTIASQSKDETDGRTLRQVIQLTFEKATDEAHWAEMYAQFCKRMLESMSPEVKDESILDKKGDVVTGGALFRKYLLTRCQVEFERGWKANLPEKPEGESEEAVMLSEEYYIAAAAKRRGLGLVRFIGELYKLTMLTERIMHECVKKLVDYEGIPDEAEVESLTSLLKTIGANLDANERGNKAMDAYFMRIQQMIETEGLPSRLRFMLMVRI